MAKNTKTVVLVADDEPSTRALVAGHLRAKGYKVIEASDGDEAWELAHEHLPHAVVLDVMMPGMSGWEVCRKIREAVSLAHTGVVMLTGIGENLNELTSPLYGADAYVDKPFEFGDLDAKLRETLARRGGGAIGRLDGADQELAEPTNGQRGRKSVPAPPAAKSERSLVSKAKAKVKAVVDKASRSVAKLKPARAKPKKAAKPASLKPAKARPVKAAKSAKAAAAKTRPAKAKPTKAKPAKAKKARASKTSRARAAKQAPKKRAPKTKAPKPRPARASTKARPAKARAAKTNAKPAASRARARAKTARATRRNKPGVTL